MTSHFGPIAPQSVTFGSRIIKCVVATGLALAVSTSAALAQSDAAPAATSAEKPKSTSKPSTPDGRVKLNFTNADWPKVLRRVARHGGLKLIMKSKPPGTFTRADIADHTVPDALQILNNDLEARGFRVVQQGNFLLVLNLDDLRSGYHKSSVVRFRNQNDQAPAPIPGQAAPQQNGSDVVQVSGTVTAPDPAAPSAMELKPEASKAGEPQKFPDEASKGANGADTIHLAGEGDTPAEPLDEKIEKADSTPQIRILLMQQTWPKVLESLAEQSGLTLVMRKCPSGTVHFREWKKRTTGEVLTILNHELEESGSNFRLKREQNFLIVLDLQDLRSEYERPVTGHLRRPVHSEVEVITESAPPKQDPAAYAPAPATSVPQSDAATTPPAEPEIVRVTANTTANEESSEPPRLPAIETPAPSEGPALPLSREMFRDWSQTSDRTSTQNNAAKQPTAKDVTSFVPQHCRAQVVARRLYAAMKGQSELVNVGLESLPSFRVLEKPGARSRVRFTVGIDTEHNRLVVEAPATKRAALIRVFGRLDQAETGVGDDFQLVSADVPRTTLTQNVAAELNRLVAQKVAAPENSPNGPGRATIETPNNPQALPELIKGLKGEVTVESVPELGILILRGNPTDVDAVMKVIREIERLGAGSAPQIHVIPLQYVNSESFEKLLNNVYKALHGLRSTTGTTTADARQPINFFAIVKPNAVLVIAPPAEMPGIHELVQKLDKPVIPDTEFQVLPLKHAYAAQVAKAVTDFYKGRTGLGTVVVAVPDARTNSVIVQARPRDLDEVAKLVSRLDGPTASQATLKVFTLTNGDASTIVRLLDALFLGTGQQRQGAGGAAFPGGQSGESAPTTLRLTADVRTNSIIAVGAPDTLRSVEAVVLRLDSTDVHQRQTVVIKLKNNSSDAVQRAINDFVRSQRDVGQIDPEVVSTVELLEREVFIISEPVSNSILLSATPRYYIELKGMIDKLDAPPAQVVIQAMLVEVTLTNDDEFGIELGFQSPVLFDRSTLSPPVTFSTTTTVNPTTTVSNQQILNITAAPGFQFTDQSLGTDGLGTNSATNKSIVGTQELTNFGVGRVSSINPAYGSGLVLAASSESVSFLLRALSFKESVHVLSRPMIRTVDNQIATVQVGKNVPIVTSFITTANGSLAPIVRYDGAGIILTVQPRITPDGMIVMHAAAEKSAYESGGVALVTDSTTGRTITSPVKDVTRAEATVSLASGETVVMGGLITSSDDTIERKVPWVADVPILGQLFRFDTKTTVRSELLIFLTPRVIRNDADDEILKQIETERLHFLIDEAESIHGPILGTKPADGLLQQVPPITVPGATIDQGAIPPSPSAGPVLVVPPTNGPNMRPAGPPELPPVIPGTRGVIPPPPVPGIGPPGGPNVSPARPGIAPPPVPREAILDDPTVPTTMMPATPEGGVRPLRAFNPEAQTLKGQAAAKTADKPGVIRYASQSSSNSLTTESDGRTN